MSEPKTYVVVIVTQEENWQDDGGAHDPGVWRVNKETFERLKVIDPVSESPAEIISYEEMEKLFEDAMPAGKEFPMTIDGVFNVWYSYG